MCQEAPFFGVINIQIDTVEFLTVAKSRNKPITCLKIEMFRDCRSYTRDSLREDIKTKLASPYSVIQTNKGNVNDEFDA